MVTKIVDNIGTIIYRNEQGQFHREDGPALECSNGNQYWYINGKFHREDGPAIEFANGFKEWIINDLHHRVDGPAIEYANGSEDYYLMGKHIFYENWLAIKDYPLLW